MVDGNGPAAIAEHVATGIAALAADTANFYVATYSDVFAYSRASGNQDGQWTMPTVNADQQLRRRPRVHDGGRRRGAGLGDTGEHGQRLPHHPTSSATPRLLVQGLGAAIGSDGSVYYERPTTTSPCCAPAAPP